MKTINRYLEYEIATNIEIYNKNRTSKYNMYKYVLIIWFIYKPSILIKLNRHMRGSFNAKNKEHFKTISIK